MEKNPDVPNNLLLKILSPFMLLLVFFVFSLSTTVVEAQTFGSNWFGEYYNNTTFSGSSIPRNDAQILFSWGAGSPNPGFINSDNFSVRWTTTENFDEGTYRFTAVAQDGIRVLVDGNPIIDQLGNNGVLSTFTSDVPLTFGPHNLTVEYVANTGDAAVQFYWEPISVEATPTDGPTPTPTATSLPAIPAGALSGTVIRASRLNTREGPSLSSGITGQILRGQTYQIIGRDPDARWYLVQLGDRQAWVYGYYIFVNGNEFNAPVTSASAVFGFPDGVQDTGVVVVARAGMRMRAEPNLSSAQTGRITWGSLLPVVGRTQFGDWYQVVWKGTVGWVFSGFLQVRSGDLNNVPIR